ncbi:MAG TPA: GrpB family protein [Caulobacteraceae bacterium]|nr:GrpB family protein [Caulobacteraceae bacterium]
MSDGPHTDEEIAAAHVGPVTLHNATVRLDPYDPAWPAQFAREEAKIRAALGDGALVLEHVGSTSIPGMAAKPILDILLAVADSADEGAYVPALEAQGYRLHIREPDWHEHRLLKGEAPVVNLHVFTRGSAEIARMLGFRDRCRTHPEEFELYLSTKRALASRTWRYVQHYANAKGEVVEAIISRALADRP